MSDGERRANSSDGRSHDLQGNLPLLTPADHARPSRPWVQSAGPAPLENLEVLVKPVHGLGGAGLHPRLEHPVAVFD